MDTTLASKKVVAGNLVIHKNLKISRLNMFHTTLFCLSYNDLISFVNLNVKSNNKILLFLKDIVNDLPSHDAEIYSATNHHINKCMFEIATIDSTYQNDNCNPKYLRYTSITYYDTELKSDLFIFWILAPWN